MFLKSNRFAKFRQHKVNQTASQIGPKVAIAAFISYDSLTVSETKVKFFFNSMLDFLRRKKRSWAITLLLAVIVVTFVLYFGGNYFDKQMAQNVAEINGEPISPRELEFRYQKALESYREILKRPLTPEMIKSLNLKGAILEDLIEKRLLLQEARRLGLEVTDEELADAIAAVPAFQVKGKFDKERYLMVLRQQRLIPAQFEEEQKAELTVQKIFALIRDSVHVTEAEARDQYMMDAENLNLHFIRLPAGDFLPEAKVSETEIKEFYEKNKEALREPLRVQVEYIAYRFANFTPKVEIADKEVEDFYKANLEKRFRQPQAVRLRHMLFQLPEGSPDKSKEAVHAKAEGAMRELLEGRDFAAVARRVSDDPRGAEPSQWLTRSQMPPALEKTAFGLKKGDISKVVESPLGLHILKLEDFREERTRTLKEARAEIVAEITREKGRNEAAKAADEDRDKALSGTEFSALAKARNLNVGVSPLFAQDEPLPDVGAVPDFYEAAFSLSFKQISTPVQGPDAYFLVKLKDRKEPAIPSFDSVRPRLENDLRDKKALDLAVQKANGLLAQLKKGKPITVLAAENQRKLEETGWFQRNAPELPKIGALQESKTGGIKLSAYQPIPDHVYTQKEAVYILALKESRAADIEFFNKEKTRLQEQALAQKKQQVLKKYMDGLKARAQINVNPAFLEPV